MNSHQLRKKKRAHLSVKRKEKKLIEAEQERKQPNEKDRFRDGATLDEILAYAKEKHLRH